MRKRSNEEKRRIVEESLQPGITVPSVAQVHGVRPGQIFEWRRAYKEGRLATESSAPTLLPVRLSDGSPPPRLTPTTSLISIELAHARIEIHGAADPVTLGIVLECLAP
jgi:transposase-like protein